MHLYQQSYLYMVYTRHQPECTLATYKFLGLVVQVLEVLPHLLEI